MRPEHEKLAAAFVRESAAAARNEIEALQADKDERPAEARLFRAMAMARKVHADKALKLLRGKVGDTEANLAVLENELAEMLTEYAKYEHAADQEGDPAARGFLRQFLKTTESHRKLFEQVRLGLEAELLVCTVCGYIAKGGAPERCPVCRAVAGKFEPAG